MNRAEKKIEKKGKLAEDYQKYLNRHGYRKNTWTYAQFTKASEKEKSLARAGVGYKKVKGMSK